MIWKPVPRYPDILVSEEGDVLLPPRHSAMPAGGFRRYLPEPTKGVVTKSSKNSTYSYYGLRSRYHGQLKIHQLVCEAFCGPKPHDGAVVLHLDEDGLNNRASNLRWGTQKENMNAPGFLAYCRSRVGENSPAAKGTRRARA